MRRIKRLEIAQKKCLFIKYGLDNRYSKNQIQTHNGTSVDALNTKSLNDIEIIANKYDCIGIDEGQFVIYL